jgi:DNA-binding CsgD family transcriptional regulator
VRFRDKRAGVFLPISSYFPHQTLLSILDDSRIGFVICDRLLRYKALNQCMAELHNVPIEAHLGRSLHQVLGSFARKLIPHYESVFATGHPATNLEVTGQLPKRSRAVRWVNSLFPLKDGSGRVTHVGRFVMEIPPFLMVGSPPLSPTRKATSLTVIQPSSTDRLRPVHLSQRELDVLRLLADGKSSKEISSVFVISVRTVETYRARLMLKLDAKSISDLVRYAIRNHVVTI